MKNFNSELLTKLFKKEKEAKEIKDNLERLSSFLKEKLLLNSSGSTETSDVDSIIKSFNDLSDIEANNHKTVEMIFQN